MAFDAITQLEPSVYSRVMVVKINWRGQRKADVGHRRSRTESARELLEDSDKSKEKLNRKDIKLAVKSNTNSSGTAAKRNVRMFESWNLKLATSTDVPLQLRRKAEMDDQRTAPTSTSTYKSRPSRPLYKTRTSSINIAPPSKDSKARNRQRSNPEDGPDRPSYFSRLSSRLQAPSPLARQVSHEEGQEPIPRQQGIQSALPHSQTNTESVWVNHGNQRYIMETIYHRVMKENMGVIEDAEREKRRSSLLNQQARERQRSGGSPHSGAEGSMSLPTQDNYRGSIYQHDSRTISPTAASRNSPMTVPSAPAAAPLVSRASTRSPSPNKATLRATTPLSHYPSAPATIPNTAASLNELPSLPLRQRDINPAKYHLQPSRVQPKHDWRRIPVRVLDCILNHLKATHLHGSGTTSAALATPETIPTCHTCLLRDFSSISLTCRSWSTVAQQRLYNRVLIHGPDSSALSKKYKVTHGARLILLRRTLRKNTYLANLTTHLHVPDPIIPLYLASGVPNPEYDAYLCLLASVVMACPKLQIFSGFIAFYNHTHDRLTHALSTRQHLRQHVWVVAENDEIAARSQRQLFGLMSDQQVFEFTQHHARWSELETLMLCSPAALGVIEHRVFMRVLQLLPSLRELCISGFDADDFTDATLLSLPEQLTALRLEELPGVTDGGLQRYAHAPAAMNVRRLSLVNLELHSLVTIAKVLSGLDRLKSLIVVQGEVPLALPLDMVVFQPLFSNRTVEEIHWDIADSDAEDASTNIKEILTIDHDSKITPNTHLALSILRHGFPSLRVLRAPRDINPLGVLQSVCQPAAIANVLITAEKEKYNRMMRKVKEPGVLRASDQKWFWKSGDLQAARFRAQMLIDKAMREQRETLRLGRMKLGNLDIGESSTSTQSRSSPDSAMESKRFDKNEDEQTQDRGRPRTRDGEGDAPTFNRIASNWNNHGAHTAFQQQTNSGTTTINTIRDPSVQTQIRSQNQSSQSSLESTRPLQFLQSPYENDHQGHGRTRTRSTTVNTMDTDITEPEITALLEEAGASGDAGTNTVCCGQHAGVVKTTVADDPDGKEVVRGSDKMKGGSENQLTGPTRFASLNTPKNDSGVHVDNTDGERVGNIDTSRPSVSAALSADQAQHQHQRSKGAKIHRKPVPARTPVLQPALTAQHDGVNSQLGSPQRREPRESMLAQRLSTHPQSNPIPRPESHPLARLDNHPALAAKGQAHHIRPVRIPSPIRNPHVYPSLPPSPSKESRVTQFRLHTLIGRINVNITDTGEVVERGTVPLFWLGVDHVGFGGGYPDGNADSICDQCQPASSEQSEKHGGIATWGELLKVRERKNMNAQHIISKTKIENHGFEGEGCTGAWNAGNPNAGNWEKEREKDKSRWKKNQLEDMGKDWWKHAEREQGCGHSVRVEDFFR